MAEIDSQSNQDKTLLLKARQDVERFLTSPANILPDFPTTMADMELDEAQLSVSREPPLKITEVLGRMYLMGAMAEMLTQMFVEDGGVVGASSWIRDVLIAESTRAAIATRFKWASPTIEKSHIIYHMAAGLHDSESIECGEEDLERWAGEFFRQLARVANRARHPDAKGIYVLSPALVHVANDLKHDKRPLAVIQMEDYLRRQRAGEDIPMVPGWMEDHQVVKQLLKDDV
ncbi:hypothetical protein C8R43DRAFT_1187002 [Mycena crocata]|nr:hypothetical protein C8R43DRAFT_1187002 [Mycena crocata]